MFISITTILYIIGAMCLVFINWFLYIFVIIKKQTTSENSIFIKCLFYLFGRSNKIVLIFIEKKTKNIK